MKGAVWWARHRMLLSQVGGVGAGAMLGLGVMRRAQRLLDGEVFPLWSDLVWAGIAYATMGFIAVGLAFPMLDFLYRRAARRQRPPSEASA